ncbi:MAG: hypothetical protein ACJ741_06540, partial [Pyrinomonadaceae bacterium]
CDFGKASEWVQQNVFPHLTNFHSPAFQPIIHWEREGGCGDWYGRAAMADALRCFVGDDEPEFWGYYSAYDHVALCQLFGTMMDLPKGFPMYTRDIKQLCDSLGNPKLPEQGKGEHDALADARWNMRAYEFLQSYLRDYTERGQRALDDLDATIFTACQSLRGEPEDDKIQ